MEIKLYEIFESIQGEGSSIGRPAIFVRLAGCNLNCSFCDSDPTIHKMFKITTAKLAKKIIKEYNSNLVVITGGEPLVQQEALISLITEILKLDAQAAVSKFFEFEIETNGTLLSKDFIDNINNINYYNYSPSTIAAYNFKFNISPKFYFESDLINEFTTEWLDIFRYINMKGNKFNIKVVYSDEYKSVIDKLYEQLRDIKFESKMYIMPLGASREELYLTEQSAIDFAIGRNIHFSPRAHIHIWDTKKGV